MNFIDLVFIIRWAPLSIYGGYSLLPEL
jgi:hypothetical protein